MDSWSSERPATASTVPIASEGAAEESNITPKLMVALVGCLVGFLVLLIGFCIVSRRSCCARNANRLPQFMHNSASPRGAAGPTAVVDRSRCQLCPFSRRKPRDDASLALTPFPSPPPPYTRAPSSPTFPPAARLGALSWWLRSGSIAARATRLNDSGPPGTPDLPPPAYASMPTRPPVRIPS